jgi:ribosomal protein S8
MERTNSSTILRFKLKLPRNTDNERFYKNALAQYFYYQSENVIDDEGNQIERGLDRFLNTLPNSRGVKPKTVEFSTDCKTKLGDNLTEKMYLENELNRIETEYSKIRFDCDFETQARAENYIDFLKRRLCEINNKTTDNTDTATEFVMTIPDNILQALQQAGFIENAAAKPLKWLKSKFLLAFFVEKICEKADNECISKYKNKNKNNLFRKGAKYVVKPFETLFNVTGITAAKNDNKRGNGCNTQSEECKTLEKIVKSNNLLS